MHNGKVHDIGSRRQMNGEIPASIIVTNENFKGSHDVWIPRKKRIVYFNVNDLNEEDQKKLKPGVLVAFNIVNKDNCSFAEELNIESFWQWEHLNPISGFNRLIVLGALAAVIVLYGCSCALNFMFDSPSEVVPLLMDCQLSFSNFFYKLVFSILIGVVCQSWAAGRATFSGLSTGFIFGLMLGAVILFPRWIGSGKMEVLSFLLELFKFAIITGLVSAVIALVIGIRFNTNKNHHSNGDHQH